jgi:type IV secretion system protein VirB10
MQKVITVRTLITLPLFVIVSFLASIAQQGPTPDVNSAQTVPALVDPRVTPITTPSVHDTVATTPDAVAYKLDAGTRIALTLKHAISTRTARENDPVYAETAFPVVSNGHIVIPVGTYVQGVIQRSLRPGRVKGRGELVIHFNTLIFPSGYTLLLPGAIDNVPGAEKTNMKDSKEGTIESQGTKGKDLGTIGSATGTGAGIGGMATGTWKGAGVGGLVGAGAGLATVLLTRGPDVRIESGALVEMVLDREIIVERQRTSADTPSMRVIR